MFFDQFPLHVCACSALEPWRHDVGDAIVGADTDYGRLPYREPRLAEPCEVPVTLQSFCPEFQRTSDVFDDARCVCHGRHGSR